MGGAGNHAMLGDAGMGARCRAYRAVPQNRRPSPFVVCRLPNGWIGACFIGAHGMIIDASYSLNPLIKRNGEHKMAYVSRRSFVSVAAMTAFACGTAVLGLTGCGSTEQTDQTESKQEASTASDTPTYKVGLCNYVDDASLNQICDNIKSQLAALGKEKGVQFDVDYQNANADANIMSQIISNFQANGVDIMVGVATPVAVTMQAQTEENQTPVVFSAVTDPEGCGLVDSIDNPGHNVTGTSDALNTEAVFNLMLAVNPDLQKVGLLYNQGEDSSTKAIEQAKAFCADKGIEVVERTGTNNDEVLLAAQQLVADKVEAIFTPTDNTIMTAELSIYETIAEAKIPHYCGADSFALNGAFLGYGVNYANLGIETANMVASILLDGADPATTPVMTFDNGIATVNTETCEAIGLDFEDVKEAIAPLCTDVKEITTADEF